MKSFREFMEILSDNPGPGLAIFALIFWILIILLPTSSSGASADGQINTWLSNIPESVAKLEIISIRNHPIYKAIGYETGTVYFFSADASAPNSEPYMYSQPGAAGFYPGDDYRTAQEAYPDSPDPKHDDFDHNDPNFWQLLRREYGLEINIPSFDAGEVSSMLLYVKQNYPDPSAGKRTFMSAEYILYRLLDRCQDPAAYNIFKQMLEFEKQQIPQEDTYAFSSRFAGEIAKFAKFVRDYAPHQASDFANWSGNLTLGK